MLNKNFGVFKLTINQLILSGIHVGHAKNYLNDCLKSYLYGHYNHFYVINLYYTNFQLKVLSSLIIKLIISRQKLLFLKSTGFGSFRNKFDNIRMDSLLVFDYN